MARTIASFELLGVKIRLDASWILLALLIAWSLAAGFFPALYRGLPQFSYWGMAAATILGVAASIILHELGHTLVARLFGLPIRTITLFIFGGVAEMEGEPKAPLAELLMAVAGPLVSVLLGLGFFLVASLVPRAGPPEILGVLHYLGVLNITVAVFNMLPAFPLDGGRVLRSLIWRVSGDVLKATRIAAGSGEIVGIIMMALGALTSFGAGLAGGLWWIIMGWFIYSMARAQRAEAEAKRLLSGARVGDLMTRDPVTAPADMSVNDFVETVLARFPHDLIPVTADDHVVGAMGFTEAERAPRQTWLDTPLADAMTPMSKIPYIDERDPIEKALERLQQSHSSRLLVFNQDRLVGILTLKDLAAHLRFRTEFNARDRRPKPALAAR